MPHRRQVSRRPRTGTRGKAVVGRESALSPPASSARKVPARLRYSRRKLWLTRDRRAPGTGAGRRPGGSAGLRDHLRQQTASRAFPSAATGSLQALKPRLVLTATSLPISPFAVWTNNVPHHCSQEDFQVLSHRCAARSLLPRPQYPGTTETGSLQWPALSR